RDGGPDHPEHHGALPFTGGARHRPPLPDGPWRRGELRETHCGARRTDHHRISRGDPFMNWTLEVVIVPVSDVDRAKAFYAGKVGFNVDHDTEIGGGRIVQLTPPGSGCSIVIGEGVLPKMEPGSLKSLQLVVNDVRAAQAELAARGVDVTE